MYVEQRVFEQIRFLNSTFPFLFALTVTFCMTTLISIMEADADLCYMANQLQTNCNKKVILYEGIIPINGLVVPK